MNKLSLQTRTTLHSMMTGLLTSEIKYIEQNCSIFLVIDRVLLTYMAWTMNIHEHKPYTQQVVVYSASEIS